MTMIEGIGKAMAAVGRVIRGDSWRSSLTNVGVNYGKNAMTFTPTLGDYLADETIARMYELDGLASRIVDAVPKHAMRHAPTVTVGDAAQSAAVKSELDDLKAWPRLLEAWTWARLFGGGGVFIGADDGRDPALPLDERENSAGLPLPRPLPELHGERLQPLGHRRLCQVTRHRHVRHGKPP
jgi:hypothetical protein